MPCAFEFEDLEGLDSELSLEIVLQDQAVLESEPLRSSAGSPYPSAQTKRSAVWICLPNEWRKGDKSELSKQPEGLTCPRREL